jgi:hypothetical protein
MVEVHEGLEQVRVFEAGEPCSLEPSNSDWREVRGELRKNEDSEWVAEIRFWDARDYGISGTLTIGFGVLEDSEMPNCIERVHAAMNVAMETLRALT